MVQQGKASRRELTGLLRRKQQRQTCDAGYGRQDAEADHGVLSPVKWPMQLLSDAQLQQPLGPSVQNILVRQHSEGLTMRAGNTIARRCRCCS